ncbi:hypothetical protein LTR47_002326 [Exophiala xenobiotica]|nr:hypothetical protein LTR41_005075 [Exophiala xenobiotica]KAK5236375.1 hypothetical protein LTR47_002326 [Exophiala xenobiotica]KAK5246815.1 hypothetical protein LTS06_007917 [Exophiala xenobiotica]KAK5323150.1 hypothetical protein LTR93_005203 [Exophiala xenobiotica]KAK5350486.1 hypothetical protein LTR61_005683 [Exophiala xenobiotica]
MRLRIAGLLGSVFVSLAVAGSDGWESTTTPSATAGWVDWSTSYVTVPTTYYSTIYSTETCYITDTTTETSVSVSVSVSVQIESTTETDYSTSYVKVPVTVPTTILETTTDFETSSFTVPVTVPTTIYNTTTSTVYETSSFTVPVTVPTTIYKTTTVYETSSFTVPVTVPTTIVSPTTVVVPTTVVSPTTIVSERTITSIGLSTLTDTVTSTVVSDVTTTVSTCSSSSTLSGLVTCTSRIINPTYTPKAPLPSNYHWGCPPGTICTPPQINCNWEQNPPAESYVCSPDECKPSPPLPVPSDWNSTWPTPTEANCAWDTPVLGFFHLNPELFDLSFAIFDIYGQPVCPTPSPTPSGWQDWNDWPKATATSTPKFPRRGSRNIIAEIVNRQALGIAPAACYGVFDNTQSVAQGIGYVYNPLCPSGTDFMNGVSACRACSSANGGSSATTDDFPKLQNYFTWCQTHAP